MSSVAFAVVYEHKPMYDCDDGFLCRIPPVEGRLADMVVGGRRPHHPTKFCV